MGLMDGKVALISGGARGQGRSHALTLAKEGADIVVFDICEQIDSIAIPMATPEDLEETTALVEALDRRCIAVQADARDYEQVVGVVSKAIDELGKIDTLVVNHGVMGYGMSWELSEQEWGDMIDTNLTAPWLVCKAAIPHMIGGEDGGSIVLTSSGAGLIGFSNFPHYTSAKHGLIGLMRALALELAPYMIRVNAICPGTMNTTMIHSKEGYEILAGGKKDATWEEIAPFFRENIQKLPIDQLEPEDTSNAILYLVSDLGRYVTGTALPVDAGAVMK